MDYTRQNDHYAVKLADDLLNCCESKMADFLKPIQFPYYTQDMITNRVLTDVGQLKTLLDNASRGTQYINYAPTYLLQDSKKEWFKNNKKEQREIGSIIYKGKDENGNKHYEMMSPAGKFNPGINESPATQTPVPNIGICRQNPVLDTRDPKGIEKYITDVIGNYFNAAFTKTPYFPPQWGSQETEMLSKALNADPALAIRTSQQAFNQATSVKMENTVNRELNDNVRNAMKMGLPPFNTIKQDAVIGPVNINGIQANGIPANGVPTNGVDFVNSYYNGLTGKNAVENSNTTVTQNGFIPYQTHNEKSKNVDNFLVEEYGNIMNASLTGTPYSGLVTPAQLKTLSTGIEEKISKDPAYMSGIVNQAHQNVLGCNYMPYDKEDFIKKAQDPSSGEYKALNQAIENHLNDIIKKNKMSFNGEFQELSKELTENRKKTADVNAAKKPQTGTNAQKATSSKTPGVKTPAQKTADAKKAGTKTATGKPPAGKTPAGKPPAGKAPTGKAPTASNDGQTAAGRPSATGRPFTADRPFAADRPSATGRPAEVSAVKGVGDEVKKALNRTSSVKTPAGNTASTAEQPSFEQPPAVQPSAGERPSFAREVNEFIKKNIIEKKPALVLVDTFLGTVVEKTKKIIRTGKTIAAAFVIATNVLAPNLQLPTVVNMSKIAPPNPVTISVNQNDFKSALHGTVKPADHARQVQHQHVKSVARR